MATEIINNKCPACGVFFNYTNGSAPKFCENCGAKLELSAPPAPAAVPAADMPGAGGKPAIEEKKL